MNWCSRTRRIRRGVYRKRFEASESDIDTMYQEFLTKKQATGGVRSNVKFLRLTSIGFSPSSTHQSCYVTNNKSHRGYAAIIRFPNAARVAHEISSPNSKTQSRVSRAATLRAVDVQVKSQLQSLTIKERQSSGQMRSILLLGIGLDLLHNIHHHGEELL